MSLRIRLFAWDADEQPSAFGSLGIDRLDAAQAASERGDGAAPDQPNLVCVGVVSADDEFEAALFEVCQALQAGTGQDFTTPGRHWLPYDELASFAQALTTGVAAVPADGRPWHDAAKEAVNEAMTGFAHLGWEVFWDQAGVRDGPDEQPVAAAAWTGGETSEAIGDFLDITPDAPAAER
jgi:hypothetical protein